MFQPAQFGLLALAVFALAGCSASRPALSAPLPLDTNRIAAADKEPQNWLTHGRTYTEQRYSPLAQVNADTVGKLGLAWVYELIRAYEARQAVALYANEQASTKPAGAP